MLMQMEAESGRRGDRSQTSIEVDKDAVRE